MSNTKSNFTGYDIVRKTQEALYLDSGIDANDFDGLINLFSPEILAEYLGLWYHELEEIPTDDRTKEVAGLIDFKQKTVFVSMQFPADQRRLTGMHENIHWMLHRHAGLCSMHRDRPISYLPKEGSVKQIEWEATNVACQYLMPEKLVKEKFAEIFKLSGGEAFEFNENTAFFLNRDFDELRKMDDLGRARQLATAQYYSDHINPLHQLFKMSPTAMAIRLLELNLLAPDRYRGSPNLRVIR